MELFIFSKKLPFIQRVRFAESMLHGAITILMGRNWSLKFSPTSDERFNGYTADVRQVVLPEQEASVVIVDKHRSILNDE
ncbi:hypothetical protein CR62_06440 [Serratia grimesii]|uniref:Uncharacterized protein n=1 Tax=Serratia grimesii TaxID=82995 RepID=A0ABR4U8D1_9GAMM|nr:hypothetical protein CR62_06440 [Serratia grimesii]